MKATRDSAGNYIVSEELVKDIEFWKCIAKYALEAEIRIAEAYARTWGEEGEIALEKLAEELFGIKLDFTGRRLEEYQIFIQKDLEEYKERLSKRVYKGHI